MLTSIHTHIHANMHTYLVIVVRTACTRVGRALRALHRVWVHCSAAHNLLVRMQHRFATQICNYFFMVCYIRNVIEFIVETRYCKNPNCPCALSANMYESACAHARAQLHGHMQIVRCLLQSYVLAAARTCELHTLWRERKVARCTCDPRVFKQACNGNCLHLIEFVFL